MDMYDSTNGEKIKDEIGLKKKMVKIGLKDPEASRMEPLKIPLVWVMTNSYWHLLQEASIWMSPR